MTVSRVGVAVLGLGAGLLFYLAYRSDQTLSNRCLRSLCGATAYANIKEFVRHWFLVPSTLRGCLPSALWSLIVASLFGGWKLRRERRSLLCIAWLCPWFNAGWEVVQAMGWTDGRGDWQDVVAGFAGWGAVQLVFIRSRPSVRLVSVRSPWRLVIVTAGFACMGFADVWK
jgi:hypothetical protein